MTIRRTGWRLAAALATAIAPAAFADPSVTLDVRLPDALAPDTELVATIGITLEELKPLADRLPTALIQVDVPASVELDGEVLTGRALQRREFVEQPFEQVIDPAGTELKFRLTGSPAADERLGVSVILFLEDEDGGRVFARRRVDVPLTGGATASTSAAATDSGWGRNGTLEIGERVPGLTLPRTDGSTLDLTTMLGSRPIVITTYRAFW